MRVCARACSECECYSEQHLRVFRVTVTCRPVRGAKGKLIQTTNNTSTGISWLKLSPAEQTTFRRFNNFTLCNMVVARLVLFTRIISKRFFEGERYTFELPGCAQLGIYNSANLVEHKKSCNCKPANPNVKPVCNPKTSNLRWDMARVIGRYIWAYVSRYTNTNTRKHINARTGTTALR